MDEQTLSIKSLKEGILGKECRRSISDGVTDGRRVEAVKALVILGQ